MSISDLVARLRYLVVETKHGKGVRASIAAKDVLEAAAEIERLRAVEDEFQRWRTSEANEVAQWVERATDAEDRLAEAVEVMRDCIALLDGDIGGSAQQTGVLAEARAFLAKLEVKP